jgi:hypothetical protein
MDRPHPSIPFAAPVISPRPHRSPHEANLLFIAVATTIVMGLVPAWK